MTDRSGFGPYADARLPAPVNHLGTDRDEIVRDTCPKSGSHRCVFAFVTTARHAEPVFETRDASLAASARLDLDETSAVVGERRAFRTCNRAWG